MASTELAATAPFSRHVLQRTVVLPELRIVFLPVPKAACTSVLWLLSELAGIPAERFAQSPMPEVSAALTVHDMNQWAPEQRLGHYDEAERRRMLDDDGWLRFSIVRDPAPRLWSAWQSKLLLREPRFVEQFGRAPWFPRIPQAPGDLVEDFRRFVAALPSGAVEDVHWSVQHELVDQLPLTHLGRVERLSETLELLRAHVPADRWPADARRDNRSPLSMPPHAYDEPAAAIVAQRHAADYEHFGYNAPLGGATADPAAIAAWEERVAPLLPLVRELIDEHVRVAQLHRIVQRRGQRTRTVEERLETVSARQVGHSRSPVLTNAEGEDDYTVRWGWAEEALEPGFTAVLRLKDEAASLPFTLPPLLRAVRRVVIVDNGSSDGTPEVARTIAAEHDAAGRLELHRYPFAIARCGSEHLATAAASVHSLAYFYNWSFAHVRTTYALKWDGDMVLTDSAVNALRDLSWQLEATQAVIKVPRMPLYLSDDRRAFLDTGLRNVEPWAWPNRPGFSFVKAIDWELPLWGADVSTIVLPDWGCVELKRLDADEFAHWSPTDFDASARTKRKQRELEVFDALNRGGAPPPGVIAIEAPPGRHVVDHVREHVLPQRARG